MATAPQAKPAAPDDSQTPTEGDSQDPIIAQLQQKIRQHTPAQYAVAVQKIYLAGMKLMFSPQTHKLMLQHVQDAPEPGSVVGSGVVALITMMYQQSKGTMPIPAATPAGVLLVCEALDFMEKSKMIPQVTPQMVDSAVQTLVSMLMQKVGLTPDKMNEIAVKAAGGAPQDSSDPTTQTTAQPDATAAPAASPAPAGGGLIQGAQ